MKALLFTNLFPTPAEPTVGLFTAQLANELARLCRLTVVAPLPWFPDSSLARNLLPDYARRFARIPHRASRAEYDVVYARYPLLPKISENVHARLVAIGVRRTIERLHAQDSFDVINAHWLYPDGVAAVAIGERLGVPVVLTALGCDANEMVRQPIVGPQIVGALRRCSAVTAVSAALAAQLASVGVQPGNLTVIPNGVDTARFSPRDRTVCRRQVGVPDDSALIVCVARLSPEKGVRHLLTASAALRNRVRNARIVLVGDGPEREEFAARLRTEGLDGLVQMTGMLAHDQVAAWMGAADVVCIPSDREGHPNAAMEALASGRPIVATSVGSLTDLITAELGVLVPPGDPAALADGLSQALSAHWDPRTIAASVSRSSWANAAGAYLRVMQSVVRAPRSQSSSSGDDARNGTMVSS